MKLKSFWKEEYENPKLASNSIVVNSGCANLHRVVNRNGVPERWWTVTAKACNCKAPRYCEVHGLIPQPDAEQRIHNAYEVYANMEGFLPATAPEGYLLKVIGDMVKELKSEPAARVEQREEQIAIIQRCFSLLNPFDANRICQWCRRDEPEFTNGEDGELEVIDTHDPKYHNKACEFIAAINAVSKLAASQRTEGEGQTK